jgi:predicted methyltransferase
MKLKTLHIRILKNIFKSENGLFIFTLFQRLRVSPKDLFEGIVELVKAEFILEEKERISLTQKGKEYIINNKLASEINSNKFDKIPDAFIGRRIGINEFYLPKDSSIYQEFISSKDNLGGTKETSTSEV